MLWTYDNHFNQSIYIGQRSFAGLYIYIYMIVRLPALNRYRAAAQINDFRIFVCDFRRKRNKKRKRKVRFRPKTQMAETIKSRHFRAR